MSAHLSEQEIGDITGRNASPDVYRLAAALRAERARADRAEDALKASIAAMDEVGDLRDQADADRRLLERCRGALRFARYEQAPALEGLLSDLDARLGETGRRIEAEQDDLTELRTRLDQHEALLRALPDDGGDFTFWRKRLLGAEQDPEPDPDTRPNEAGREGSDG